MNKGTDSPGKWKMILSPGFAWSWICAARQSRMLQLDTLRGIAIFLVLGRHFVVQPERAGRLAPLAEVWARMGWTGVDLFFVLSGFLIGGLLFGEWRRHGSISVRRFLIRRGFKIWPAYLVYILFLTVGFLVTGHGGTLTETLRPLFPNYFHLQNYLGTPRVHTWSLAVEEHFYLALPLLLWGILQLEKKGWDIAKRLPWIFGALMLAELWSRYQLNSGRSLAEFEHNYYQTHLRTEGMLLGVLLAYYYHFKPKSLEWSRRHAGLVAALGLLLISPMIWTSPDQSRWTASLGLSALYAGYALIVLAFVHTTDRSCFFGRLVFCAPSRLLGFVGFYSYSIYLWHVDMAQTPLKKIVAANLFPGLPPEGRWLVAVILYAGLAVFAGIFFSSLIENPCLALRDRFFPSNGKAMDRVRSEGHDLAGRRVL